MGALDGLKILDISFFAPVRTASMYLADFGADVISVEMRREDFPGPIRLLQSDTNSRWLSYQRNKRSISLNLKSTEGKKIFNDLVKKVDVVLEGFGVGTAKDLGVDYSTVKKLNPKIIYCSVTGFGQTGPYAKLFGHEPNYQGLSGVLYHSGTAGGPPAISAALIGDIGSGALPAVIGVLMAVVHRSKTGKGQYIDVAIADGALTMMIGWQPEHWAGKQTPERGEAFLTGGYPAANVYRTKDGGYVSTSAIEHWNWEKMCRALGREDLIPRDRDAGPRREEVFAILKELFASKTRDEWGEWNMKKNVGITPVLSLPEVLNNPHFMERKMVVEVDYEPMGKVKQVGIPIKLSETPGEVKWLHRYGADTDQILKKELGYTQAAIDTLRAKKAIE